MCHNPIGTEQLRIYCHQQRNCRVNATLLLLGREGSRGAQLIQTSAPAQRGTRQTWFGLQQKQYIRSPLWPSNTHHLLLNTWSSPPKAGSAVLPARGTRVPLALLQNLLSPGHAPSPIHRHASRKTFISPGAATP